MQKNPAFIRVVLLAPHSKVLRSRQTLQRKSPSWAFSLSCVRDKGVFLCTPKIMKEYPAPTPKRDPSLNHSDYTRPPQKGAQLFRPWVSGEFDIWHPWLETRASLLTCAIFTVDVLRNKWNLSKLFRACTLLHPTQLNYCTTLTPEVFNMLWKRAVGWGVGVCVTTREKSDSEVNVKLKKKLTSLENCECLG